MSSGTLQLVCAAQLFRHMIEEGECAKVRGTSLISIVEFAQIPYVVVQQMGEFCTVDRSIPVD